MKLEQEAERAAKAEQERIEAEQRLQSEEEIP